MAGSSRRSVPARMLWRARLGLDQSGELVKATLT
jgi:hypothetical protein